MNKKPCNTGKSIGQKIKERREQLNLTQEELGKKFGVSQNTINVYENKNWKNPSARVVSRLAMALSVPTTYLLDDNCQVLNDIDEEILLTGYRKLDDKRKKLAVEIIKLLDIF